MMKQLVKGVLFFLCIHIYATVTAQDSIGIKNILTPQAFAAIVKSYHPIIKQADINVLKASANITVAKAGFDPSFYIQSEQKTFNGVDYYQYTNPELKIPTWYGIEVKAGLENNSGNFLNSESSSGQSSYLGITVPLAKNLVIDKRRAALQQAKIFNNQSSAEKLNTINDVLYDAYSDYWNWVKEYEVYKILSNTVTINKDRFNLIKIGFRQGDRPAIDTIEALAQLQSFEFLQSESAVKFKNAGVTLSAYLWLANDSYYQLNDNTLPDSKWNNISIQDEKFEVLDKLIYTAKTTHPKLRIFNFKMQILEVDRKLKFQSLLPTINVKANLLNKGYDVFKNASADFYQNNNKFGIDIGLPLRLSEGRGSYKIAKLKIKETTYQQNMQVQEIENKVRYYFNEVLGLQQQIKMYEAAYKNYQTLLRGEDTRFTAGESSLFILNNRENKVLEVLQKLVELKTKFFKAQIALQWATGQLN
jgi:outer membrane protein TolC